MTREIKFRIYSKAEKAFIYAVLEGKYPFDFFCDSSFKRGVDDERLIRDFDLTEWQQYTGLKDKNGKEIYEGDIAKIKDLIGVVGFEKGKFVFAFKSHLPFETTTLCEIIGNIYQNPEGATHFNILDEMIGQIEALPVTDPKYEETLYDAGLKDMKNKVLEIINKIKNNV